MGPEEIAMLLLISAHFRNTYSAELKKDLPDEYALGFQDPILLVGVYPEIALKINKSIRQMQNNGLHQLAAGLMVWLHTMRGAIAPELRYLARRMWKELEKGMDETFLTLARYQCTMQGLELNSFNPNQFPIGFEPQHQ